MNSFFRRIRHGLFQNKKFLNYSLYALGEIILVVVGILIALQINNWNEEKKEAKSLHTNILSIKNDLVEDSIIIEEILSTLQKQEQAAQRIIPVLESKDKIIKDSLEFILDFNELTTTPIIIDRNNTWQLLTSNGTLAEFPDPELLDMLNYYYNRTKELGINFTNSANPVRLELRKLKYELFEETEHRKFFPTPNPKVPSKKVYNAIFEDNRILPLGRYIGSTASYFEKGYEDLFKVTKKLVTYISENYDDTD
ncbi:DUF6090 family protein [Aegicerativicinus sediminis]